MSDGRTQRQRMLDGDLYIADDPELAADSVRARRLQDRFNRTDAGAQDQRCTILGELLGAFGPDSEIRLPLYCDYGYQMRVDARVFANFALSALDVVAITIGDDVWLGGGVIVPAGVTIGENTVVGTGSVVTRDLPAGVVAVGTRRA